jgi:hypothetical protein
MERKLKVVHLVNKEKKDFDPRTKKPKETKREGLFYDKDKDLFTSCCWDFDLEEAQGLIGGLIYLHDTKADNSFMGGIVVNVQPLDLNIGNEYFDPTKQKVPSRSNRVWIEFESTHEGKGVAWNGQDYAMAWTSGIIDVDAT